MPPKCSCQLYNIYEKQTLQCGHYFCKVCFREGYNSNRNMKNDYLFICPSCKVGSELSDQILCSFLKIADKKELALKPGDSKDAKQKQEEQKKVVSKSVVYESKIIATPKQTEQKRTTYDQRQEQNQQQQQFFTKKETPRQDSRYNQAQQQEQVQSDRYNKKQEVSPKKQQPLKGNASYQEVQLETEDLEVLLDKALNKQLERFIKELNTKYDSIQRQNQTLRKDILDLQKQNTEKLASRVDYQYQDIVSNQQESQNQLNELLVRVGKLEQLLIGNKQGSQGDEIQMWEDQQIEQQEDTKENQEQMLSTENKSETESEDQNKLLTTEENQFAQFQVLQDAPSFQPAQNKLKEAFKMLSQKIEPQETSTSQTFKIESQENLVKKTEQTESQDLSNSQSLKSESLENSNKTEETKAQEVTTLQPNATETLASSYQIQQDEIVVSSNQTENKPEDNPISQPVQLSLKQIYPRKALSNLISEYEQNENIKRSIQELQAKFNYYRSVRSDGNSYYRAIGFAYLEHLARITTPENHIENFITRLESNKGYYQIRPFDQNENEKQLRQTFLKLLQNLKEWKSQKQSQISQLLMEELSENKDNNDEALVWQMRCLTANYLESHREHFEPSCKVPYKEVIQNILTMGTEAVGLGIGPLQVVLKIKIELIAIEKTFEEVVQLDRMKQAGKCPLIFILHKSGHFDIIYSIDQSNVDGYDELKGFIQEQIKIPLNYEITTLEKPFFIGIEKSEQDCPVNEFQHFDMQFNFPYISTENQLKSQTLKKDQEQNQKPELVKCEVCSQEIEKLKTLSLKCNHLACKSCLDNYITQKTIGKIIIQETEDQKVTCFLCSYILSNEEIEKAVGKEKYESASKQASQNKINYQLQNQTNSIQLNLHYIIINHQLIVLAILNSMFRISLIKLKLLQRTILFIYPFPKIPLRQVNQRYSYQMKWLINHVQIIQNYYLYYIQVSLIPFIF